MESEELQADESIARFLLRCDEGEELKARVWWRGPSEVPSSLSWRVGDQPWRTERWLTSSGWTWSDHEWAVHSAADAVVFVRDLLWLASGGETLHVEYERDGRKHSASFVLSGAFETPVQGNLVQCAHIDLPMDEQGRFVGRGDLPNGWYVAGEDEDGLFRSYLVVVSEELQAGESIARVQLRCDEGEELKARVWWRGPSEVPSSLSWRVGDQPWRMERWRTPSGWSWGDDEWAVHAAVDAVAFVRDLLWSASGGETLHVEYERDGHRHAASFVLTGVFETPVHGNLI